MDAIDAPDIMGETVELVANAWLKILHRMWKDRLPYDEKYHRNNQRQTAERRFSTDTG